MLNFSGFIGKGGGDEYHTNPQENGKQMQHGSEKARKLSKLNSQANGCFLADSAFIVFDFIIIIINKNL